AARVLERAITVAAVVEAEALEDPRRPAAFADDVGEGPRSGNGRHASAPLGCGRRAFTTATRTAVSTAQTPIATDATGGAESASASPAALTAPKAIHERVVAKPSASSS